MRTLGKLAASAALASTFMLGAFATAQADNDSLRYRVVGIAGSNHLDLMNGPARWAGVEVSMPFDARGLRATGVVERNWVQLSYQTEDGYDHTGWADGRFLADDGSYEPTVYRVIGGKRGSIALRSNGGYGAVLAYVPYGSTSLYGSGPCQDGYCLVRYRKGGRDVEGWAPSGNLVVTGAVTDAIQVGVSDEPAYLPPPPPDFPNGYAPHFPHRHAWFWNRPRPGQMAGY